MCVAAAIIGGAVGTGIAGSKAAKATERASDASIQAQREALAQQAAMSAPYRGLGESAIPQLQSLLGLTPRTPAGTGSVTPAAAGGNPYSGMSHLVYDALSRPGGPMASSGGWMPTPGGGVQPIMQVGDTAAAPDPLATLRAMPGYQFAREQGLQGVTNAATAQGLSLSGNTLEALDRFGTGLADQTYQQEVGNLENVVGMGQAAAAGQAANIGNAASNIGSTLINQGNTMAGINANTIAGITKAIGSGVDQYGTMQTLAGLNDPGIGMGGYSAASNAGILGDIGYPSPILIQG